MLSERAPQWRDSVGVDVGWRNDRIRLAFVARLAPLGARTYFLERASSSSSSMLDDEYWREQGVGVECISAPVCFFFFFFFVNHQFPCSVSLMLCVYMLHERRKTVICVDCARVVAIRDVDKFAWPRTNIGILYIYI